MLLQVRSIRWQRPILLIDLRFNIVPRNRLLPNCVYRLERGWTQLDVQCVQTFCAPPNILSRLPTKCPVWLPNILPACRPTVKANPRPGSLEHPILRLQHPFALPPNIVILGTVSKCPTVLRTKLVLVKIGTGQVLVRAFRCPPNRFLNNKASRLTPANPLKRNILFECSLASSVTFYVIRAQSLVFKSRPVNVRIVGKPQPPRCRSPRARSVVLDTVCRLCSVPSPINTVITGRLTNNLLITLTVPLSRVFPSLVRNRLPNRVPLPLIAEVGTPVSVPSLPVHVGSLPIVRVKHFP